MTFQFEKLLACQKPVLAVAGQRTATQNALGYFSTFIFDAVGQTVASIDALGNRTTNTFDEAGRRIQLTDALGRISIVVYDTAGQGHNLTFWECSSFPACHETKKTQFREK